MGVSVRSILLLLGAGTVTIALVWLFWLFLFKGKTVDEEAVRFVPIDFAEIDGWQADNQAPAFATLLRSCAKISSKAASTNISAGVCKAAFDLAARGPVGRDAARAFFEAHYTPNRVIAAKPGRVTGYYEPELDGALKQGGKFQVPVYGRPADLVQVKPDEMRARFNDTLSVMRKSGDDLVPYYTREEIDKGALKGQGLELLYLADPVELFFMQVQGSGRVRLADGTSVRLGYAAKNGHPYVSIGKRLLERGENKGNGMSMQRIKEWIHADSERGKRLMWENQSYVFFAARPGEGDPGPIGAQGVPLTPERSLAVDASYHALGLPVFVDASELKAPDGAPFRRLMIAQDVGSAIKGPERGDIFWGSGDGAGAIAGSTLAPARFIILLPNDAPGS